MERIKRAIEHAKKTGPDGESEFESHQKGQRKSKISSAPKSGMSTIKWVASVSMIFLAAGAWLRLDCMNQNELQASAQICDGIEQARAEARKRAATDAKFEKLIVANYNQCKASAEKSRNDYVKLVQNAVLVQNAGKADIAKAATRKHNKAEQYYIPPAAIIESKNMLRAAQAECLQIYESQKQENK